MCASVAFANDMTYVTVAKPHQTVFTTVEVPSGKSMVSVRASHDQNISCIFIDRGTGKVAFEARNVPVCLGKADLVLPARMLTKVANDTDQNLQITIWVYSTK